MDYCEDCVNCIPAALEDDKEASLDYARCLAYPKRVATDDKGKHRVSRLFNLPSNEYCYCTTVRTGKENSDTCSKFRTRGYYNVH